MILKNTAISLMVFIIMCSTGIRQGFSYEWKRDALDLGVITPLALSHSNKGWIVLDCRPKCEFLKGHIKGAFSFSWEDFTYTDQTGVKYRIVPPKRLARALEEMGIDEKTPLVVYGDADTSWGGEGWAAWVLSWLGHQGPIRLLSGGLRAWEDKGLPIEEGEPRWSVSSPKTYNVHLRKWLNISAATIKRRRGQYELVDVRGLFEWLRGRVPGATRISWKEFYEGHLRSPIGPQKLKKLLEENGVDPKKPVVYYCTGGVRSGYAWFVHMLTGIGPAINFEGGIEEWNRRTLTK